jgi:hypothetical protein
MKIEAEITLSIGQYENIKPTITIDTEDIGASKDLICKLWDTFHNLVQYRPTPDNNVDVETQQELNKTDWEMQKRFDRLMLHAKGGPDYAGSMEDYQIVVDKIPDSARLINEAKKEYKRSDAYKSTLQYTKAGDKTKQIINNASPKNVESAE